MSERKANCSLELNRRELLGSAPSGKMLEWRTWRVDWGFLAPYQRGKASSIGSEYSIVGVADGSKIVLKVLPKKSVRT